MGLSDGIFMKSLWNFHNALKAGGAIALSSLVIVCLKLLQAKRL